LTFPLIWADGGSPGGDGGHGRREDGEGVHEGEVGDRKLKVEVNGEELKIESERGDDKFEINVKLKEEGGLRIDVESRVNDAAFQQRQRFTVYFAQIIQYSGGGSYTGDRTPVKRYSLADANWREFKYTQNNGKYLATTSTSDGVFVASFEFSGQPFSNGNLRLTPADLKINIGIRNFPYSGNTATDRLALAVVGKAKASYRPDNGTRLVYNGGSAFAWVPTAVADNVTVNVVHAPIVFHLQNDDSDDEKNYFSIFFSVDADRPSIVDWDPTVSTSQYAANSATTIIVNLALICVMMLWM